MFLSYFDSPPVQLKFLFFFKPDSLLFQHACILAILFDCMVKSVFFPRSLASAWSCQRCCIYRSLAMPQSARFSIHAFGWKGFFHCQGFWSVHFSNWLNQLCLVSTDVARCILMLLFFVERCLPPEPLFIFKCHN